MTLVRTRQTVGEVIINLNVFAANVKSFDYRIRTQRHTQTAGRSGER